jgi:hypothetical protein
LQQSIGPAAEQLVKVPHEFGALSGHGRDVDQ